MTETFEQVWTALTSQALVWWGNKETPLLLYRHNRWHFILLGLVRDSRDRLVQGIRSVNFMSTARAKETVSEWLPYYHPAPFDEVSPWFEQEVHAKILPTSEDYRPWLRQGRMKLIGGLTTDTLEVLPYEPAQEERLIILIQGLMRRGAVGPYLAFETTGEWLAGLTPK